MKYGQRVRTDNGQYARFLHCEDWRGIVGAYVYFVFFPLNKSKGKSERGAYYLKEQLKPIRRRDLL